MLFRSDALVDINELNEPRVSGAGGLLPPPTGTITFYYDVSGDGFISPLDPLVIINFLNDPTGGEGESEEVAFVSFLSLSTVNNSSTLESGPGSLSVGNVPIPLVAPQADQSPISPATFRRHLDAEASSPIDEGEYADLIDALLASFGEW